MKTTWFPVICLTIVGSLLWNAETFAQVDSADDHVQRHCFGLIWCTEQSADGRSVDGMLWLYSSEDRGSYSRMAIRPFYAVEEDPTKNLLRRSILWPLGMYERNGSRVWSHIFPLYWHGERPGYTWTFIAPLYWESLRDNDSWFHLFPLFSRHTIGEFYARNFVVGPLLMTTRDSRTDLTQWDLLLSLLHSRQDVSSSESWMAPIYWSGEDRASGQSYLYILPFFGSAHSETQHYHFLFPFYGSDVDSLKQTSRLALLGLPPFRGAFGTPTLSLFEYATSADESSHRLFPVYRYVSGMDDTSTFDALLVYRHQSSPSTSLDRFFPLYHYESDTIAQTREFDLFGYGAASWFRYEGGPASTQHRLLGLYNYDHGQDGSQFFSLIGYRRSSLYLHRSQDDLTEDRIVFVHDYFRHGESSSLSLLGLSELALYRQESSPSLFRHRLFPIYRYSHDLVADETDFDALLLYRHLSSPTRVADRLLPLWDYASATTGPSWRLSLLGFDAFALYRHDRDETRTVDHLFPLYGYHTELDGSTRLSLLGLPPVGRSHAWSLYEHDASPASVTDRLFPLYRYRHDRAQQETTLDAALLYRHVTSPVHVADRLFPLWDYADATTGPSWQLSLLGLDAFALYRHDRDETRTLDRLFPLYSYHVDSETDTRSLSALWIFWRTSSPTMSQTSLFPLTSWSTNDVSGERTWSLIGLDPMIPVSWIRHSRGPDLARDFFAPLYDYEREGDRTTLSMGGISHLALYRSESTPTDYRQRLFPLYWYHNNLAQDTSSLNVLLAYQQERSSNHAEDTLYPLWHYERRTDREEGRFNALGFGRFSLYEHHREPSRTSDRLFPLYRYTANHDTDEKDFSLLWPLVDYKSRHGAVTSASLLWWLISYDHPDTDHFSYYVFGGSKMAMVRRIISPHESLLEINPVLPLYRYRSTPKGNTSWDLCYGLIGMDSTEGRTNLKLLGVSL